MNAKLRRDHLMQIYQAAIRAVHPTVVLPHALAIQGDRLHAGEYVVPLEKFNRIYVAGAGKASGTMAAVAEKILGEYIFDGVVAVKEMPTLPLKRIRPIIAGHPLPDRNSMVAAEELLNMAKKLSRNDLLIFLLSGGASSLVTDVPAFCTIEEMNGLFDNLINSGASIHEINSVRKHLSAIKGGQLAKHCQGTIVTLIISDVVDNDLSAIGSGPTVGDTSTFSDALHVIDKYGLRHKTPPPVVQHLEKGVAEMIPETPRKNDPVFRRCSNFIIADIWKAMAAAAQQATLLGYETVADKSLMNGNTGEEATRFVQQVSSSGDKTRCFIKGGETSLHVTGSGKGGRNQHFALSALMCPQYKDHLSILAAGTDGNDGPTDAAGAFADALTAEAAKEQHLTASTYRDKFDAYHFFQQTGSLFIPGPTGTNVMDLAIALT